jgi:DNA-binding LacI/PurR family transcriptional regulator
MKKTADAGRVTKTPAVTLKALAAHLGLAAGTVSSVLNNSPASKAIPEQTRDRIFKAAREFNYRPNFLARSLRVQRTYTVGVIAEEIGDAYGAVLISGVESVLRKNNYFFLTVVHRHEESLMRSYSQLLLTRGAEGIITIDTSIDEKPVLPTVAIAGHQAIPNVTNVILDHHCAARLVLQHLIELGHRQIAFFRGPSSSSDSAPRWNAIQEIAADLNLPIREELVLQLENTPNIPEIGYVPAQALLAKKLPFTAVFAYNDTSAMGAMAALQKAGLTIPDDVSVVGFDDIDFSSFAVPPLTTVHQPLLEMGTVAAQTLLDRIEDRAPFAPEIALSPKLMIRNSTGPARQG